MNNSESNLSPDDLSRNLPFLGPIPGGEGYACLLETEIFPVDRRSQTLDNIGVPEIEMVDITRSSTSVPSGTDDELHALKRY